MGYSPPMKKKVNLDLTLVFIAGAIGIGYGLGQVAPRTFNSITGGKSEFKKGIFDEAQFKKERLASGNQDSVVTLPAVALPTPHSASGELILDSAEQAREYLKKFVLSKKWESLSLYHATSNANRETLTTHETVSVFFDTQGLITMRDIQFSDGARIWTTFEHGSPIQSFWISAPPAFASQPL